MVEQRRSYRIPKKVSVQQLVRDLGKMGYRHETEGIRQASYAYFDTQDGKLYSRGLELRLCTRDVHGEAYAGVANEGLQGQTLSTTNSAPTWQLIRNGTLLLTQVAENDKAPDVGVIADHISSFAAPNNLLPYLLARQTEQEMSLYTPNPDRDRALGPKGDDRPALSDVRQPEHAMLLRFEHWSFRSPFRGEWSAPQMIMMVEAVLGGNEVEYLHTLLRDLVGLAPFDFEPFAKGLEVARAALPGVPVPDRYRLTPKDSVYTAIGKITGKQVYKMWGNTDGTLHDLDVEFLHDLRVATRRARFAMMLFKEHIGKARAETLRKELSWIAKSLGRVRDIDVFQEKFFEQFRRIGASEEMIQDVVGHYTGKRYRNLESMKKDLQSDRYVEILDKLRKLEGFMMRKGQGQGVPVVELIPGFIEVVLQRMASWLHRSADSLTPNDLHELRIEFKGLRYTTEFFSDLYAGEMRKVIGRFVQFQDCLGLFQDAQVASLTLRSFSEKSMKKGTARVDVMLGVGGLIQIQREIWEQQQAQFLSMWNIFPRQIKDLHKLLQTKKFYNHA